jgi:hypothetical protein
MDEQIKVLWMPRAAAMRDFFRPLLERSYQKWLGNNRKDVVSEYCEGTLLLVTFITPEGQVTQLALRRDEIPDLPREQRELLERQLKIPAVRGWFEARW